MDDNFVDYIDDQLFRKPFWYEVGNKKHKKFWTSCISCNQLLRALVFNDKLRDDQIKDFEAEFDIQIQKNIDLLIIDEQVQVAAYYSILLGTLLRECENEEMYESCYNLKRFLDLYYKNTTHKL